jgi:hypothetical protein
MFEKEWFQSNRYYQNLDEKKLSSIFYFTLIWNLFEKELCNTFAHISTHPKAEAEKLHSDIDKQTLHAVFAYFKHRYITPDGHTNDLFDSFKFGQNSGDGQPFKEFVRQGLVNSAPSDQEQLQALLYIVFRLRNNLYHGIKDVAKLYEQNENFKQANHLLVACLEAK